MTQSAIALSPRAIGAPDGLASLSDDEMLRIAGGFAMIGGAILAGCAVAGAIIAVCVVGAVVGAAVYLMTQ
jgi:hypothetical protein